jgi:hypothetical protein
MAIVLLTVKEACAILEENGMKITPVHLRAGIDCGAYPFGNSVKMDKSSVYEIFRPLLMQWIEERSE